MNNAMLAAVEQGALRALDYQFGAYIQSLKDDLVVSQTAVLLSQLQGENHVCLDLGKHAGQELVLYGDESVHWPELKEWQQMLQLHPAVSGPEQANTPMVLVGEKLYLGRYWHYEKQVAQAIQYHLENPSPLAIDEPKLIEALNRFFPENERGINWQKVACLLAQLHKFLVITGGPGTGKTTTVIRLLALCLMQQREPELLQIRLVAPTGKAAVRMTESIRGAKSSLQAPESIKAAIPESATTIHRLLGAKPGSVHFRHNSQNKLHLDLLVVDEASMIDLPLMAKLLAALPAQCQVILLGDKDQLSSVEAGSVLGDLCEALKRTPDGVLMRYSQGQSELLGRLLQQDFTAHQNAQQTGLGDLICMLQKSYRFGGGIGKLADAVNQGRWPESLSLLSSREFEDIAWQPASPTKLVALATSQYACFMESLRQEPSEVLKRLDDFRVLCASHSGELGTEAINQAIEKGLRHKGLVQEQGALYPGLPLMILRNDYDLKLFNGDIGVVLPASPGSSDLRVFFLQPGGEVRSVLPGRLPEHDVAYAMTIHKSQGSEFSHVALALPAETATSALLSRELLYTGITRAKKQVTLFASEPALKLAVNRRTERDTGLYELLNKTE